MRRRPSTPHLSVPIVRSALPSPQEMSRLAQPFADLRDPSIAADAPQHERGVFEETDAPPGTRAFRIYNRAGHRMARIELGAAYCDDRALASMDAWLEAMDPREFRLL